MNDFMMLLLSIFSIVHDLDSLWHMNSSKLVECYKKRGMVNYVHICRLDYAHYW